MRFGFVYLWYDTKHKKFYLGSHLGLPNDGYTGSNRLFQCKHKNRPDSFKRRILESHDNISSKQLLMREQIWLSKIKPEELGIRYYNQKLVAAGGDIIGNLSTEKKKQHAEKSGIASKKYWNNISNEEYMKRKENCFGGNNFSREYLSVRNKLLCSKKAIIYHPAGNSEEIHNIAEFCRIHNINYQNFKTVLRGKRKSCKGFKGSYI